MLHGGSHSNYLLKDVLGLAGFFKEMDCQPGNFRSGVVELGEQETEGPNVCNRRSLNELP
jgi:hypothetical protein